MSSLILIGTQPGPEAFCATASPVLQFIGWILLFFRISIPLVIIGFGMFDFGKAVVASKDEEIKTAFKQLVRRAVAGIIIFFIPVLVMWVFGMFAEFNRDTENTRFEDCQTCVLNPAGRCRDIVRAEQARRERLVN